MSKFEGYYTKEVYKFSMPEEIRIVYDNSLITIEAFENKVWLVNKVLHQRFLLLPDWQIGFVLQMTDKDYKRGESDDERRSES